MPVKVLLADDAEIVRGAIRKLLADSPEIVEVVGEAVDFPQTVQMVKDLSPHIVILDLHIARRTEPSEVKDRLSKSKVLAVSFSNDDESKKLAERFGAVLLLDKTTLYDELLPAIAKAALPTDNTATI